MSARQYPSLHRQYVRMAEVLDVHKLPELFIKTSPLVNAYAYGSEDYFIVVTSSLIDLLTENELLAIIGHELGHVKCEHMVYITMVNMITQFGAAILEGYLPGVGQLTKVGVQLALLEWYRKAEFSCDRAALLATQDLDAVCGALAKLAGFSKHLNDLLNIEEIKRQAEDYEDFGADSLIDKVVKVSVLMRQTHPYPVVRVNEISKWANSTEYARILSGQYETLSETRYQARRSPALTPLNTPTGLRCPLCKSDWPAGTRFCGKCATDLRNTAQIICGYCHGLIEPDWLTCPTCGSNLRT